MGFQLKHERLKTVCFLFSYYFTECKRDVQDKVREIHSFLSLILSNTGRFIANEHVSACLNSCLLNSRICIVFADILFQNKARLVSYAKRIPAVFLQG